MKRYVFSIALLLLLPLLAFADVGPKPSMYQTIMLDGKVIQGEALVCYDVFFPGSVINDKTSSTLPLKVRDFLKPLPEQQQRSCSLCSDGMCYQWFYSRPSQVLVAYPIQQSGNGAFATLPSTNVYLSQPFAQTGEMKRSATVSLNPDSTATVSFAPLEQTPQYVIMFVIAFVTTLFVELILGLGIVLLFKKSNKLLLTILFMNCITVFPVWFFFPVLFQDFFIGLAVAEVCVFVFEALFIRFRHREEYSLLQAFVISFLLNSTSFVTGLFIGGLAYMIGSV